jgi:two-component system chemotaxis response regulator CheB
VTAFAPTPRHRCGSDAGPDYDIVGFGGSAGGITALTEILSLLPATFRIPILAVQHLPRRSHSSLPMVLGYRTLLKVKWAEHGERPRGGTVYVAPAGCHLMVAHDESLDLSSPVPLVNCFKPAIDPLFESIARVFGKRGIAIVLSGMMSDGMRGSAAVRNGGGIAMAQSEVTSMHFDMPCAAIDLGGVEIRFSPRKIADALCALGCEDLHRD